MKTRNLFLAGAVIGMVAVSCAGGEKKEESASKDEAMHEGHDMADHAETTEAAKVDWVIDAASSNIRWEGGTAGAQVYSHFGDIAIKEGKIATEGVAITAGMFVVDMTTIEPKDEGYSEEHPASDLVGHLSTEDFFLISEHPTSTFTVKSVNGDQIVGDLTVKGTTNEETVTITDMTMGEDGTMRAAGTLTFDRQKYNVAWAHYLQDVVLSDDITLEISLVAKKA